MKKISTLVLGCVVATIASAQINTFPWTEDFESQANGPTGCGPAYTFVGNTWTSGDDATPAVATHQVDFTVDEGGTSSSGTGPAVDHTLGTNTGHYIYAETSCNGTGYSNREFNIVSPYLDFTALSSPEITFWYHALGGTQGDLTVWYDLNGDGVWMQVGGPYTDNIDLWQEANVSLIALAGEDSARVRLRYVSGTSFTGDIGLDDITITEPAPFDLAALDLTGLPSTGCGLDSAIATYRLVQIGADTIPMGSAYTAYFNDGTNNFMEMGTTAAIIAPGDTLSHTFQSVDYSVPGTYVGYVSLDLALDSIAENDSINPFTVNSLPEITSFPYREDFANGNGGFIAYNTTNGATNGSWAFGTPAGTIINSAASDTNCFKTGGLAGDYNAGENSWVESPCFNFTNSDSSEWLGMNVWWESEISWDGANITYTNDGGATWNLLGNFGSPNNWYTDNTINGNPGGSGEGWTGRDDTNNGSGGWVFAKHELDTTIYGKSNVIFRINFGSDGSVQDEGFAFDDFTISTPPTVDLWPDTVNTCSPDSFMVLMADTTFYDIDWVTTGNTGAMDTVMWDSVVNSYIVEFTDSMDMCDRDTVAIRFVMYNAPDLGPDILNCDGDTVVHDAGTDSLTTYTYMWSSGDSTQMVTTTTGGTYTVTKWDSTGYCIDSSTVVITNTMPVGASGDTTLCDGETATIMADGGSAWAWSTADTTMSVDVTTGGTYSVVITDSIGCVFGDSVVVGFNALPTVDLGADSTICANHVLTLDAGNAGSSFSWAPNGETTQMITVDGSAGTATYTVTVTDANGCSEMDDVIISVDPCTGIGELSGDLLVEYFPNPTSGQLTVNVQDLNQSDLVVSLFDLQGRSVFTKLIPANGNKYTVQLNLGDVATGVYQLRFDNGKETVVSKLVVR